ncbi:phage major capsid protein [Solimonas fluminis]|nr:phage major capsid protein [Solimonas fluminis]
MKLYATLGSVIAVALMSMLFVGDASAAVIPIGGMASIAGIGMPMLMAGIGASGAYGGFQLRRHLGTKGGEGGGSGGDNDDPEAGMKKAATELKRLGDELKSFAETAKSEIKKNGEMSAETKAKVDELLVKQAEQQNEFSARIAELEQKSVRRGSGEPAQAKSVGEQFVEHADFKAAAENFDGKSKIRVGMKSVTSLPNSGGALVRPDRIATPVMLPDRRLTVVDLLTPGRTSSNLVEYVRETGFVNNANVVSEGARKPESNITFELDDAKVRTIAHWIKASRQILSDAPGLASMIDGRLRYGLDFKKELQVLKGSGVGENLHGIIPQASAFTPAFTPMLQTRIDILRLSLLQAELAEYPATGIVLHPTDWAQIELTKTTEGAYVFANPVALAGPVMWGRPVVATQAMDLGEFLTGAFRLGAQYFDREQAAILVATENEDDFVKNLITILAEERGTLAVYRPEAFNTGDFGDFDGT